jgi:hypothetical protein|tara:strand:+ start:94 stop:264 length:171 start_codon:yes stop_codon:yes gene_type:complete
LKYAFGEILKKIIFKKCLQRDKPFNQKGIKPNYLSKNGLGEMKFRIKNQSENKKRR